MSLRFQCALMIENLPDEQLENSFEVIMPNLSLNPETFSGNSILANLANTIVDKVSGYQPIVESIVFGVRNFGNATRRVRTGWCNIPDDILNYQDVSITMFCSSGMLTQYYLEAWKSLIFNQEGEFYYPMCHYKKNIEVFFFGPGNIGAVVPPVAHYTLQGCYPSKQEPYKLQYDSNPKRLRISCTFKIDRVVYNETLKNSSILQETVTSPTSILDKAITMLSPGVSSYDITKTYT